MRDDGYNHGTGGAAKVLARIGTGREVSANYADAPEATPVVHRPLDLSATLRPGVYILRHRGQVTHIGAAKVPLARIAAHLSGDRLIPEALSGLLHTVRFDSIELRPCAAHNLAATYTATCQETEWSPQTRQRLPTTISCNA